MQKLEARSLIALHRPQRMALGHFSEDGWQGRLFCLLLFICYGELKNA
jgi:hypothetical protein